MSKEKPVSKEKKSKGTVSEEALDQGSVSEEQNVQAPKVLAPKLQEIKLHEIKRPANLRADAIPDDGYVLSVDGKLKKRYETSDEAMTAGMKLKQDYPVIQIAVYDAAARRYTPVALPEK
jgi:hypothetical protein